jgi:hypothetical protein
MTIEPSDFPNDHGQDDHFDHDHNTISIIKWSKLTDADISTVSTNFNNFNNKKIWNWRNDHDQSLIDHFDHENFVTMGIVMVKF